MVGTPLTRLGCWPTGSIRPEPRVGVHRKCSVIRSRPPRFWAGSVRARGLEDGAVIRPDTGLWDGHVAMIVGHGPMIEARNH